MTRHDQKLRVFVEFAERLATLSTCKRAQVGCIVVTPDFSEVLSIGYNGPPVGRVNDACRDEIGNCGCVHAEANAIAKLSDRRDSILICTTGPCESCAGLIANRKTIREVHYVSEYRYTIGLDNLRCAGVDVCQIRGTDD